MIRDEMTVPTPSSETAMQAHSSAGKIAIVTVMALALGAFFYFDLGRFLSLAALKDNRDHLLVFTEANSVGAAALFVLCYIAVTGLSLPGAVILTLAGGFLFGSIIGTLLVNLGATAGATLAFLAARYLLRDWVEERFGKWLEPLQQGFAKNAFSYLVTLRLIPHFPFFAVNLVSGLTRMNVGTMWLPQHWASSLVPSSMPMRAANWGPSTRWVTSPPPRSLPLSCSSDSSRLCRSLTRGSRSKSYDARIP